MGTKALPSTLQITKLYHAGDFLLPRPCLAPDPHPLKSCLQVHTCFWKWGLSSGTLVPGPGDSGGVSGPGLRLNLDLGFWRCSLGSELLCSQHVQYPTPSGIPLSCFLRGQHPGNHCPPSHILPELPIVLSGRVSCARHMPSNVTCATPS